MALVNDVAIGYTLCHTSLTTDCTCQTQLKPNCFGERWSNTTGGRRPEKMENVMFHGNSMEYFTCNFVEYKTGPLLKVRPKSWRNLGLFVSSEYETQSSESETVCSTDGLSVNIRPLTRSRLPVFTLMWITLYVNTGRLDRPRSRTSEAFIIYLTSYTNRNDNSTKATN